MQRNTKNPSSFSLPKINEVNKSFNSSISTTSKLKIPPAFEPDIWICNHGSRRRSKSEDVEEKTKKIISLGYCS